MVVGNFRIIIVCANEIEDGLYGDIYTAIEDCRSEHPTENIIYGFYCERVWSDNENLDNDTPDWFDHLTEAVEWAETHK